MCWADSQIDIVSPWAPNGAEKKLNSSKQLCFYEDLYS